MAQLGFVKKKGGFLSSAPISLAWAA